MKNCTVQWSTFKLRQYFHLESRVFYLDLDICISNLEFSISNLEFSISNLNSFISNLEFSISNHDICISKLDEKKPSLHVSISGKSTGTTSAWIKRWKLLDTAKCSHFFKLYAMAFQRQERTQWYQRYVGHNYVYVNFNLGPRVSVFGFRVIVLGSQVFVLRSRISISDLGFSF